MSGSPPSFRASFLRFSVYGLGVVGWFRKRVEGWVELTTPVGAIIRVERLKPKAVSAVAKFSTIGIHPAVAEIG